MYSLQVLLVTPKGPYVLDESTVAQREVAISRRLIPDDYGEWAYAYILTVESALESADSGLESANSSADSKGGSPKIDVWVQA